MYSHENLHHDGAGENPAEIPLRVFRVSLQTATRSTKLCSLAVWAGINIYYLRCWIDHFYVAENVESRRALRANPLDSRIHLNCQ